MGTKAWGFRGQGRAISLAGPVLGASSVNLSAQGRVISGVCEREREREQSGVGGGELHLL